MRPRTNPEGLFIMFKNTILCCDLKTILSSDRIMKAGKSYTGILRREVDIDELCYDEHFTFTETLPWTMKRNPRVYAGKHITVTRRDDGSLRLNFRPLKTGYDFSIERYALGVYNEICMALEGLVGEE